MDKNDYDVIEDWETLVKISTNKDSISSKNINYDKIAKELLNKPWVDEFNIQKKCLNDKILYKLWETMFLMPIPKKVEFDSNTQTGLFSILGSLLSGGSGGSGGNVGLFGLLGPLLSSGFGRKMD